MSGLEGTSVVRAKAATSGRESSPFTGVLFVGGLQKHRPGGAGGPGIARRRRARYKNDRELRGRRPIDGLLRQTRGGPDQVNGNT